MSDAARLYDFASGTLIVSAEVDAEFNQLVSIANLDTPSGMKDDLDALCQAYRFLVFGRGELNSGHTAATRLLSTESGTAEALTQEGAWRAIFHLDPADFTVGSRSTKYRIRASCITDNVAPATTMTVGLYPVTAVDGATSTVTVGTVTSGSTVAFASPSANTLNQGNSGDFTAPAAGFYALGVANAGTPATNADIQFNAFLQMRQV